MILWKKIVRFKNNMDIFWIILYDRYYIKKKIMLIFVEDFIWEIYVEKEWGGYNRSILNISI